MSRIGDLQDIRTMFRALNEAMGNDIKNPWPTAKKEDIHKIDEIKDPWAGMPGSGGVERVSASRTQGAKPLHHAGSTQRWEQLGKAEQQRVRQEHHAAAEGKGLVDPWGPRPPALPREKPLPDSGLGKSEPRATPPETGLPKSGL